MKKRLLSALLALCMMLSLFPVSAFASANFTRGGVNNAEQPAPQADTDAENGDTAAITVKKFYVDSNETMQQAANQIYQEVMYQRAQNCRYEIILRADVDFNGRIYVSDPSNEVVLYSDASEGYTGNYTITCTEDHGYGYAIPDDVFEINDATLTLGREDGYVTIKAMASTFGNYGMISGRHKVTMVNCILDGNNTDRIFGINITPDTDGEALNLTNCTIRNFTYPGIYTTGGTVNLYNSSVIHCGTENGSYSSGGIVQEKQYWGDVSPVVNLYFGSSVKECTQGGVYVDDYGMLNMEDGSSITDCSGSYGGVYVDDNGMLNMKTGSKIYNNTASRAGSDIYISDSATAILVDAASMNATDASGHTIDGWYPDDTNNRRNRYDATKHVDPVDVSDTLKADSTTGGIGLVASHAVYDIAFAGDNAGDCSAYSDAACTKEITVAAPGDKVYLKYAEDGSLRSGLTEDQCISWEGVTGDSATEGSTKVRVIGADPDTYFTMPKEPVGNKVTLTPTVMNTADVDDGSDPEVPGSDDSSSDGSSDSGAGAIMASTLIGGTAYLLGTRVWLESTYGYVPANRMELALGLWKRADCPAPVSTELYPDIDEEDADAQAATHWCVEQGLLKDYHEQNDDGTETVTFKPGRYVARPYALNRWYKLEKLLGEQQSAAQTAAEAPAETDTSAEA